MYLMLPYAWKCKNEPPYSAAAKKNMVIFRGSNQGRGGLLGVPGTKKVYIWYFELPMLHSLKITASLHQRKPQGDAENSAVSSPPTWRPRTEWPGAAIIR